MASRPAFRTSRATAASSAVVVRRRGASSPTGAPYRARTRLAIPSAPALDLRPAYLYPGRMSSDGLESFRRELRTWLEANVPADLRIEEAARLPETERVRRLRAWQKRRPPARGG